MIDPSGPRDTTPEVQERLVARWRAMSAAERGALAEQASIDVTRLAEIGIRLVGGPRPAVEVGHQLARRRYGDALADEAYRGLLGPQ